MSLRRLALVSALALAFLFAAVYGTAHLRAARAEAAHPPEGAFVEVEGRRIHYVEMGEGPPVVLIHGAFGSARDFTFDLAPRLSERYRVIAFDRPGLGYSEGLYTGPFAARAETPAEQARLLATAARQLGAERPVVVGHSFGGIVAMAWALDHDPAAAVLLAGVALPWPGGLGWLYSVNGTVAGGGLVAPVLTALVPGRVIASGVRATFAPAAMPEGYAEHIGVYMPIRLPVFRSNARQVNWLRPEVVEMEKRYPGLDLPIEIVHGDGDDTVPIAVHSGPMAQRLPTVALDIVEGAGHMPHHSHPDRVIAAIDRAFVRAGG